MQVRRDSVRSGDGTRIDWWQTGEADKPAILIINGAGGSESLWSELREELGDAFRFVSWDLRGLYRSAPPERDEALSLYHHAEDAIMVMDAADVERAFILTWSTGVEIASELYAWNADRCAGICAVNPTTAAIVLRQLGDADDSPLAWFADRVPFKKRRVLQAAPLLRPGENAVNLLRKLGILSPAIDHARVIELWEDLEKLNIDVVVRTLRTFAGESGRARPNFDLPMLSVRGKRDMFAGELGGMDLYDRCSDREALEIPLAGHLIPAEFSEYLSLKLESFFVHRLPDLW